MGEWPSWHTRARARAHAHTHARAHTHTHTHTRAHSHVHRHAPTHSHTRTGTGEWEGDGGGGGGGGKGTDTKTQKETQTDKQTDTDTESFTASLTCAFGTTSFGHIRSVDSGITASILPSLSPKHDLQHTAASSQQGLADRSATAGRVLGLVVKASSSRAADPGFDSRVSQ